MKPTAKIKLGPSGGQVVLDDNDISRHVSHVTIDSNGRETEAILRISSRSFDIETEAPVRVDDDTHAALLKLGWTPPTEEGTAP